MGQGFSITEGIPSDKTYMRGVGNQAGAGATADFL
jgi:hypothetical protein